MKPDPTRWFLARVVLISTAAILVWTACLVALTMFCLWAIQSLLNDAGAGVPGWLVIELGVCVGIASACVLLERRVATEPRRLLWRGEPAPTPPQVQSATESIAIAVGVPTPELVVVEDPSPNVAAAGSRKRSVAIVTTGAVALLHGDELEAVLGHVLSRLDTHAVTLATTASAMTGDILEWHDYVKGRSRPTQIWEMGLAYPMVALASLLRWWALRDEAQISDLHALRTVRNPDALLRAMEKLVADPSEPVEADLRNAHLWFEYPRGAVGALPGVSRNLERKLVLSARIEKLNAALGEGFIR